ncbi:MAG: helix-turn-helix domain-containing protein [bacterium]
MNYSEISVRMYEVREAKRLTLNELAKACGITKAAVNNWRLKGSEPYDKTVLAFLDSFKDINANWLLSGSGPMYKKDITNEPADFQNEIKELTAELSRLKAVLKDKEEIILAKEEALTLYRLNHTKSV